MASRHGSKLKTTKVGTSVNQNGINADTLCSRNITTLAPMSAFIIVDKGPGPSAYEETDGERLAAHDLSLDGITTRPAHSRARATASSSSLEAENSRRRHQHENSRTDCAEETSGLGCHSRSRQNIFQQAMNEPRGHGHRQRSRQHFQECHQETPAVDPA